MGIRDCLITKVKGVEPYTGLIRSQRFPKTVPTRVQIWELRLLDDTFPPFWPF